ncbi:MAG TPA: RDD family protein [Nostocaceae cyanobacterium]|nr:RDD family protein [Nostocaceae cyanobacterium]
MTLVKTRPHYYPKAELHRRGLALGVDFLGVWLISSTLGSGQIGINFVQIFVFILAWLVLRVIIVYNNQGQSLGRWAFNLKILEVEEGQIRGRIPELQALLQREGIVCLLSLLVSIALSNILSNPTAILLLLPLTIDCGAALSDAQMRQALHDRYAKTVIVSSQRGYSLDLKVKRIVGKLQRNVRK